MLLATVTVIGDFRNNRKKWWKSFLKPTDLTRPHRRQTEAAATKSHTQHPRRRPVSHPFFFAEKKLTGVRKRAFHFCVLFFSRCLTPVWWFSFFWCPRVWTSGKGESSGRTRWRSSREKGLRCGAPTWSLHSVWPVSWDARWKQHRWKKTQRMAW